MLHKTKNNLAVKEHSMTDNKQMRDEKVKIYTLDEEQCGDKQENIMGTLPMPKVLAVTSLPIIISMLVQAMYNIVDSIFVAQISEEALTAVSLAFPIQNLIIAIAMGIGVGMNSLLSKNLGEKRFQDANKAAGNGVFLIIMCALAFALFGIFGVKLYFTFQTDNEIIINYGVQYLSVCTVFSFGLFLQTTFERILQATGKSIFSMISQLTGAITNIILDPILIFGLFRAPKLGITGAAVATVIGQIFAMIIAIILNYAMNKQIRITIQKIKPSAHVIKKICAVGFPTIVMQSIGSIMVYTLNNILMMFSTVAVTVVGIYFKLQSFVFMPVFGFANGLLTIIAYNYGARNSKRITHAIKFSICISTSIMVIGLILFQIIPDKLLLLFDATPDMMSIGIDALRIISISFVFAGFCIVCSTVFQALGRGMLSLIISIVRQLGVFLPLAYILACTLDLHAVWYAFPLADIVSVILAIIGLRRVYKLKIKKL
jgi:putative MATE family efflux protein